MWRAVDVPGRVARVAINHAQPGLHYCHTRARDGLLQLSTPLQYSYLGSCFAVQAPSLQQAPMAVPVQRLGRGFGYRRRSGRWWQARWDTGIDLIELGAAPKTDLAAAWNPDGQEHSLDVPIDTLVLPLSYSAISLVPSSNATAHSKFRLHFLNATAIAHGRSQRGSNQGRHCPTGHPHHALSNPPCVPAARGSMSGPFYR